TRSKRDWSSDVCSSDLETTLQDLGAEKVAFDTMVLTGENSGLPHGEPGDRQIQYGDFLLFDFGVFVDHYCSDITRTFAIGKISEIGRASCRERGECKVS